MSQQIGKQNPAIYVTPPRRAIIETLLEADSASMDVADLRERVGDDVPPRTLTHHLRLLEALSVVRLKGEIAVTRPHATRHEDVPIDEHRVELTRRGETVLDHVDDRDQWSDDHPAGDYAESELSVEQRVGELESRVARLQEAVDE
ncbi:hypothetical protein ACFQE1_03640 [Halobium palmae]|uniref:ArsR family transcriptional regulator n=1 Tax=Halobium palmae TaxID=1776492 RepID=A0ABD5RVL8_9EURY